MSGEEKEIKAINRKKSVKQTKVIKRLAKKNKTKISPVFSMNERMREESLTTLALFDYVRRSRKHRAINTANWQLARDAAGIINSSSNG